MRERKRSGLYGTEAECWICHSTLNVERHHVYQGSRRDISEREGAWVYLCHTHHQDPRHGVHYDGKLMGFFRRDCQRRWEERETAECGVGQDEARRRFMVRFYESFI